MERRMLKKNLLISICNGLVITLFVFAIAFLVMIFSSGEDGQRQVLFDALYFNVSTANDGVVNLEFGRSDNFTPVFLSFTAILSAITFGIVNLHGKKNNELQN
jgi:hypothetical protein